jgi:hypothetical protein
VSPSEDKIYTIEIPTIMAEDLSKVTLSVEGEGLEFENNGTFLILSKIEEQMFGIHEIKITLTN